MREIPYRGCLPCQLQGFHYRLATVQHVVEGKKRLGHSWTYGACEWHHLGIPPDGYDDYKAERILGPSLAWDKKKYIDRYGSERQLVELQDVVLALPAEETYRAIRWYMDRDGGYLKDSSLPARREPENEQTSPAR